MNEQRVWRLVVAAAVIAWGASTRGAEEEPKGARYMRAVEAFAQRVLADGRDKYGKQTTPLFVDGLNVKTLEPARWNGPDRVWVLSNFASQQPLVRLLDGLTALGQKHEYRRAAEEATRYALTKLRSPNGLIYWGGHMAWDLQQDAPVGQYADVHEMKGHQPYYALFWRIDARATRQLLEAIWGSHVVDWSLLDYNRHGSMRKATRADWGHRFDEKVGVPFATRGNNLSFCNVTPSLLHSSATLATLGKDERTVAWTRLLAYRWQQGRDAKTGLCGGQLSYRKEDRAQQALGHVHPTINEAKIVATYHQSSRYHHLPLVEMQAAATLLAAGPPCDALGRELIAWASDDLKVYAARCYDAPTGLFVARMTDGTVLEWQKAKTGYYVPQSFAPQKPEGFVLWGYALAYRLTRRPRALGHGSRTRETTGAGRPGRVQWVEGWPAARHTARRLAHHLRHPRVARGDRGSGPAPAGVPSGRQLAGDAGSHWSFPARGREYARTGDEVPLALLHLAAALEGKRSLLPQAIFDYRFFHCEFHGPLEKKQEKRADARTYDDLVFYGGS